MASAALTAKSVSVWKASPMTWLVVAACIASAISAFAPGLRFMVATWGQVEEFSYGYFIPLVSAFLIWQKSDTLREIDLAGSEALGARGSGDLDPAAEV